MHNTIESKHFKEGDLTLRRLKILGRKIRFLHLSGAIKALLILDIFLEIQIHFPTAARFPHSLNDVYAVNVRKVKEVSQHSPQIIRKVCSALHIEKL